MDKRMGSHLPQAIGHLHWFSSQLPFFGLISFRYRFFWSFSSDKGVHRLFDITLFINFQSIKQNAEILILGPICVTDQKEFILLNISLLIFFQKDIFIDKSTSTFPDRTGLSLQYSSLLWSCFIRSEIQKNLLAFLAKYCYYSLANLITTVFLAFKPNMV